MPARPPARERARALARRRARRRMLRRPLPRVAAVLVLVAAVAAGVLWWHGRGGIDPRRAEREIAADYERQVDGADVERVRCPDSIDDDPGTLVRCTMRLADGTSGSVRVRVLGRDGDLRWDVETPSGSPASPSP